MHLFSDSARFAIEQYFLTLAYEYLDCFLNTYIAQTMLASLKVTGANSRLPLPIGMLCRLI